MPTRRAFLGTLTAAPFAPALSAAAPSIAAELARNPGAPDQIARDEDFWSQVASAFTIDRSVINLNNGGVSPSPALVQEAMKRHLDFSSSMPPPIALWQILEPQKEGVRQRLALHWGVDPEEIAITRNSSESLQICQLGIDLKRGDEVLCTTLDYPRMVTTFKQRERREGIVLRQFSLPIPAEDDDAIVRLYEQNFTGKTRLLLVSHMINITGQIMPVKRIVAAARSRNIPVIVDGAHALAHFTFKIPDLDCDYYGVSLHKWLAAPHGTGLLYVRRDKIKPLWPMMASPDTLDDDIRKFEEIGTHPAANFLAIGEALTFHQAIGDQRKEARLRYLKDQWLTRLLRNPRVRSHTSLRPAFSCGIATVQVEGVDTAKLQEWLWTTHKILVTPILHAEFEGLRVTPSVYTTPEELDRFCSAMEWVLANGLPA
jgi:isopenicillin-N epimerase